MLIRSCVHILPRRSARDDRAQRARGCSIDTIDTEGEYRAAQHRCALSNDGVVAIVRRAIMNVMSLLLLIVSIQCSVTLAHDSLSHTHTQVVIAFSVPEL